jgi:transcriptional regulator with XRE-family HTH domain
MDEQPSFGRWLSERRKALDLTQAELGQRVGCARITIQKLELDQRRPSQLTAQRLADHLAVPAEEWPAFIRFARGLSETTPQHDGVASAQTLSPPPFLTQGFAPQLTAHPFVGRTRELAILAAALERAHAGQGQLRFVIGDAGRGKSALVQEFARAAQAQDAALLVCSGGCNAYAGIGDPYLSFREGLAMLMGEVETRWAGGLITHEHARRLWAAMPFTIPALVRHAPDLIGPFIPWAALSERVKRFAPSRAPWLQPLTKLLQVAQAPRLEEKQLFAQVTALLKAIAAERPLLVLLEDLHWIDVASSSLLFHLSRTLRDSRVMILGTYRPEELVAGPGGEPHPLAGLVGELKRQHGDIWLDLDGVASTEGRQFVDAYLDTQPNHLGHAFRTALFQHTGGHALFTVELVRTLQERGNLRQDAAGYWIEDNAINWQHLPARVEGVIEQRIERLPAALQRVLTVASVEGESFTAEVVAHVLGWEVCQLVQRLSGELDRQHRLVTAQVLEWVGQQRLARYRFRHHLFQHYLYERLDKTERVYLHEAVGNALEALVHPQTEPVAVQLACHFSEAGLTEKAVTYLYQAGEGARLLSANREAIQHLQQGLALLHTLPDTTQHSRQELALQISLGHALGTLAGYGTQEVGDIFAHAQALCNQFGEVTQRFAVLDGLRAAYNMRGEWTNMRLVAEEMLHLAHRQPDTTLRVAAHHALGNTLLWLGAFGPGRLQVEQGLTLYDPQHHRSYVRLYGQDVGIACLTNLMMALWLLGYPDQALQRSHALFALVETLAHPLGSTYAYVWAAVLHWLRNEPLATQQMAEAAMRLASEQEDPLWWSCGAYCRGIGLIRQEQVAVGIDQIQAGLQTWRSIGATGGTTNFLLGLAEGYGRIGQPTTGLTLLAEALADMGESQVWAAEVHRLYGELLLQGGDPGASPASLSAAAENWFCQAIELARQQGAKLFELRATVSLCRLWQTQGKCVEAGQRLAEIYGWFTEGFATPDLIEAKALLEVL